MAQPDATESDIRDAVIVQDVTDFSFSLPDVHARFLGAGIDRSLRTLQRYCERGHLTARKYPSDLGDVWYVNPESVETKIEEIRQVQNVKERRTTTINDNDERGFSANSSVKDETSHDDKQRHNNDDAGCRADETEAETVRPFERQTPPNDDSKYVTLPVAVLDALTDQLRVKDEQIVRRDEELSKLATSRDDDRQLLYAAWELIHSAGFGLPSAPLKDDAPSVSATERKPIDQSAATKNFHPGGVENPTIHGAQR